MAAQDIIKILEADDYGDQVTHSTDGDDCDLDDGSEDDDNDDDVDVSDGKSNIAPLMKLRSLCKNLKRSEQLKNKLRDCCLFF